MKQDWMKIPASLWLLSLFFTGCHSSTKKGDSFELLRNRISEQLAGKCTSKPVARYQTLGRFFEVTPSHSRYRILVIEREYLTPVEWEQRYNYVNKQMTEFLSRTNRTKTEGARGLAAIDQLGSLPRWSYERVGIAIDLQMPEVVYPELEKDNIEAAKICDEIISFLKPYPANKDFEPNAPYSFKSSK